MPVWLEDELRRGATSIEAKASPFRAQELFRCSILLTAETRASLLKVQDASRKAIPNSVSHRLSPCPVLCNESAERTLLAHRFILYSIYKEKYKKTPHLQRTRSPRCHLCWLLLRNPLTGWVVVLPILHCNGVEPAKAYFVCISVWSSEAHSLTISHRFTPATGSLSRNDKLLFFLIADFRSFFLRHMLIKLF